MFFFRLGWNYSFLDDKYSPWKKPTETEEPDEFNFRSVPLFLAFVHFFKTNA